ncbi:Uncharacterized protein conserved in bacteria with the myosin-like domain [Mycoplasmopsis maculosa]|uniref:Uncharacterized protein conserved in bacteria with the myosin-like domain n=1 Tax=Mycoplasmopsis maculosa TaxID=114885 RepID=A0A449B4S5_9BACT|nr:hypothetical protein [Mycoplasmopsis maculosa]VEU75590.1 Uncharacterized protein conserved in bacteria with the myosin-like domain [Mycoplasmopsis maculosa]
MKNNISNVELEKTNLEHQYSEKQRDIDNINHDISRINNQIETLRSENQTILNDIQTLKTQKQELTDKKTRNEQEKQELERQIAEKEQEIQEKESEISNNQNEIQSLETNKSSRTNDISSKELELNNLFNSIRNLTDLNNELQSSLSQKEANKTQLEQEKSRLEETKINLESEVQSLTSDLNSLTMNISAKEQELENLNQNISNLNLEIEILNRNKSSLQEEIQRLVEQKNSQSGSNSELEQEIFEKQNQISQKQEEINEKNSEKSTFEQTKNDLLNEIQTLQIDLGRKQTNLQELTSIHTELNNKVNELTNDKSNKTQNHETLKSNLRDLLSHENDLISSISELSASINKYKELLRIITNDQDENQTITNEGRNVVNGLVKELWDKINALEAENSALDSEISTQTNKLNSLVGSENNNFDNATEDSIVGGMKNEVSDLEEKIEKIVIKAVDIEFEKKDTMFLLKRGKQTWNGFVFNNDHIGYTRFLSNRDNNVINSIYDNMRQNLRESGLQVSDEFKNAIISSSFIPNHLKSNGKLAIRSKIKIDISQQQKDELIRQGYPNLKITYRTPFDNTNKSFSIDLTQRLGFTGMNLGEHSPNSNNILVSSITANENVWGDDNFLASQYNLGINKFTIYLVYMETSAGYEIAEFIDLYTTARAEHERSLGASYSFSTLIRAKRTNNSLTSVSVPSYIYNDGNNNIAEMTNRINKSLTNAGSANTFYTDISPMLGLDQSLTYQNFGRFDSSNPNYRKTFISDNLVVKNGISFANIAFSK